LSKITVHLVYPVDFGPENKDLELSEFEFNVLTKCNKIGSEGSYFEVEEMKLEDTDAGISVTIMLK
jgi:hypothetical protein